MAGLNENHRRKILTTIQYADELLSESLNLLGATGGALRPRFVRDVSTSESHWVESYAGKIREQMSRLLERFEITVSPPNTLSSWALRTKLMSLDIALEDLYPGQMRGYGEMDPAAGGDLTWTLQEVRRLVSQLLAFLAEASGAQEKRLARIQAEPALGRQLERLSQIIARHGLVEYLSALDSIIRKLESHRYEIAVFGRVSCGKSSLINRLLEIQLLPVGSTPITAVPIHIIAGDRPQLKVSFPEGIKDLPVERLPEFATEQGNPANSKRVVGIEVAVPAKRLQEGVAFVDTPGIASLATSGTKLSYAYLPDSDLGVVLVDGHSSLGRDDLDLLRSLHAAGIPSIVLISKCDLLPPDDIEKVVSYTRAAVAEHLGASLEVIPISSVDSWVPKIHAWFEQTIAPSLQRARESLTISLNRKAQSLRESILVTLEMRASRGSGGENQSQEAERALRPLDESLDEFARRWQDNLETMDDWAEEALGKASSRLARASGDALDQPGQKVTALADAVIEVAASRYHPFLQEYESLAGRIRQELDELRKEDPSARAVEAYELPRPSALPSPVVSLLDGVSISDPGPLMRMSQALRERHFRRDLEEMAGRSLQQLLDELRPRLRHWFVATINALRESFRLQTDPLRYRQPVRASNGSTAGDSSLMVDIEFLRGQAVQAEVPGGPQTEIETTRS
ncbi:MAG: dynamin family protein [Acidobacteriia bacterium]|nr:dynamin family protein [Terriglobia bacterium]